MTTKKDAHAAYQPKYKYHLSVGNYDGGACLIRHQSTYTPNDSCSYRWQGLKKAESQPGRAAYDAHRTKSRHIGEKRKYPNGDEVTNFTTGFVPYGNQVHHVLNNSSLQKAMDELAVTFYPIRWVIANGLLGEKYNINHKDNNMILPTTDYQCKQTGLPKHYGSHPQYSTKILSSVQKALKPYEKIADQMKKDKKKHDKPDPESLKDDLEHISDTMYNNIMTLAAANRGKTALKINDLPLSAYAGI